MIVIRNGTHWAFVRITAKLVPVIEIHEDDMKCVIECPYCSHRTTVGETLMISGHVGCPNCYFVPGGLLETTLWYQEHNREEYTNGNFYKRGYIENRDSRVLKKKVEQNDE